MLTSLRSRCLQVPVSTCCDVVTTYIYTLFLARLRELDESICAAFAEVRFIGFNCADSSDVYSDEYDQQSAGTSSS
jgi:hypothetical protein